MCYNFICMLTGLPDPPVDIQVEAGPQDGTLLVTWLPVGLNASTNGAPVTGYAVYADGKKVTDVDSPTGMILEFPAPDCQQVKI
jgi:RIMS-binding protein 2